MSRSTSGRRSSTGARPRRRTRSASRPASPGRRWAATSSALTRRPISRQVAMTGEITLRGRVLPVGGLKEKILAAHRAGIKTFVAPRKNKNDMIDLPPDVRREIHFVYVEHMDEVLATALREPVAEL